MPLEETGNLLVMLAAVAAKDNSTAFVEPYWELVTGWADYLLSNGLYPSAQLSSDDFDGPVANRTNLAAKAIIGVGAYAQLCAMRGNATAAAKYRTAAEAMVLKWYEAALDGDHLSLVYGEKGTWGMLYNLWLDDLLQTKLFDATKAKASTKAFYARKVQQYGLPLDDRNNFTIQPWNTWVYSW
jgi:hypothetical protein